MVPSAVDVFWSSVGKSVLLLRQSNGVGWLPSDDAATDVVMSQRQSGGGLDDVLQGVVVDNRQSVPQPAAYTHSDDTGLLTSVASSPTDRGE